jgi:hypothetical protein
MIEFDGPLSCVNVTYTPEKDKYAGDSSRHTITIRTDECGADFEVNGVSVGAVELTFVGNWEFDDFLECIERIAERRLGPKQNRPQLEECPDDDEGAEP